MIGWAWVLAGALLGSRFARFAAGRGERRFRRSLAIGLVVAASVYVVFAAAALDLAALARAVGGVAIFAVFASLGVRWGPGWLTAGWALHVVWDVALHGATPDVAPAWYALLCLGFDLVVAGASGRREG